mmetsp:Transcript_95680/g.270776  ORF Transcript_95680/g.270776 Transcript_95680/m.270776 type:complete len:258 (+) Transcript_95680:1-774(+)
MLTKEALRQCMVMVQRYHPYCAVPRRTMQQLNLFFVTHGGGWSRWKPRAPPDATVPSTSDAAEAAAGGQLGSLAAAASMVLPPAPTDAEGRWRADEILPGLLLGGATLSVSLPLLKELGVTHVVNVTPAPDPFPGELKYCKVAVEDDRNAELLPHLGRVLAFIHAALVSGEALEPMSAADVSVDEDAATKAVVLVHCREGVSRSVAVVLAYLMRHHRLKLDDALTFVRSRRPPGVRSQPNTGFFAQLKDFEANEWLR